MGLVDYDLADGQLAHAAGGTPSKPHEWMVSNLLSPYSSTLAKHAQSDSGGCGKLIVSGFINAEDNKATEHSRPAHQQLPLIGRQRRQTRSGASMARGPRFFSPAVQSAPWSYESSSNDVQMMLMQEKTEQTAPASSPGLVHHPKMGAESYNRRPTATQAPLDLLPSTLLLPRSGVSGLASRTSRLLTTAVDV